MCERAFLPGLSPSALPVSDIPAHCQFAAFGWAGALRFWPSSIVTRRTPSSGLSSFFSATFFSASSFSASFFLARTASSGPFCFIFCAVSTLNLIAGFGFTLLGGFGFIGFGGFFLLGVFGHLCFFVAQCNTKKGGAKTDAKLMQA